jgi:hypothetical protein
MDSPAFEPSRRKFPSVASETINLNFAREFAALKIIEVVGGLSP